MKKLVSVLLSAVVLIPQCVAAVDFKTYSILSTGKWVKIKTVKSGIYELSYDELRVATSVKCYSVRHRWECRCRKLFV